MDPITLNLWLILCVFVVGYGCIIFEHTLHINKATSALLTSVLLWILVFFREDVSHGTHLEVLYEQLAEISEIVLFLIGALGIVETLNAHHSFDFVRPLLHVKTKRSLFWIIGILSFALSGVLDNLTTTIVMLSLISRLFPVRSDRYLVGSAIVIAANAGGAWTPLGDVTTTMLWIGGQLSTTNIVTKLFLPSILCMLTSVFILSRSITGKVPELAETDRKEVPHSFSVLILGVTLLLLVPIFKVCVGLPPFLGMLFGLGVIWAYTDWVHFHDKERKTLRLVSVLTKIDLPSVLFFLGILLSVGALEESGILSAFARILDETLQTEAIIACVIGLLSAVIDNVPLVAATMKMYKLGHYPQDANFWNMIAYAAGTGGSLLVIGSAAGVVFMGIEKVSFFWYLRHATIPALIGYVTGGLAYLLLFGA